MKRLFMVAAISAVVSFCGYKASAQLATFDFSNLSQAVLSFLQDGDNMALNTTQFLENLGVAKDQLEFLKEMDRRYREVRQDLYKAQEVVRIARNYEMMASMFTMYVDKIRYLNGSQITYHQGRTIVNEGFQYLLFASREVKRAREYLSAKSRISEEERLKGLIECDRQISKANIALYSYISDTYSDIDRGRQLAETVSSFDDAFKINY